MSRPEDVLLSSVRLAVGTDAPHARLFRNTAGTFWAGHVIKEDREKRLVILENALRVTTGLQPGGGDLVGWISVIVTPDMVGQRVAIFAGPEIKTPRGRADPAQITWRDNVTGAGGIAGIVRSPDEALALIAAAPGRPAL